MKALCFSEFGGSEVLKYQDLPAPTAQPGCAIVRMQAIGLNFADIYRRRGNYHIAGEPPYILGYEGAGVIESVELNENSSIHFQVGDRVAFADSPFANAELVSIPLEKLIPLPAEISFEVAAALLLQGLTAQYLINDSHKLQAGETILVHAVAGGVGLLLTQLAKLKGAKVWGLTSTTAKGDIALQAGADRVWNYSAPWVNEILQSSKGVDVVYDSIGSTLNDSFKATRTGGHVVFYGMAGGEPPAIDPRMLMDTSKTLTGGDLWNMLTSQTERIRRANELFELVGADKLQPLISQTFALADGAQAHDYLEGRGSIGKILLIP